MKRRLAVVSGIIVIVIIVLLAVVGSGNSSKSITVAQAATGDYAGSRVQVTGNVLKNSYHSENNTLYFTVYDADNESAQVKVEYQGSVAATFGNDVTAICTGKMDNDGTLACTELVTKCPSKYESGDTQAFGVADYLAYDRSKIEGTMVKVRGTVATGTLVAAGAAERFALADADDAQTTLSVKFDGALSDEVKEGAIVIISGSLNSAGVFEATDVALEG